MKIAKPTDADREYFRAVLPDDPRVEVKPMFGNLGAFVNGNMFAGLFGADVGVRVPAAEGERLLAAGGGPFGPAERPMSGYVTLPAAWRKQPAKGATWTVKALDHVSAMPAKVKKSASKKATPQKAATKKAARETRR